eukprot:JP442295.1.p2 GENE.JP442295.1~~JP442295.1.p2  ORF type:complete len:66 (-),score=8.13 JP442295.1:84-257(-)
MDDAQTVTSRERVRELHSKAQQLKFVHHVAVAMFESFLHRNAFQKAHNKAAFSIDLE